MERPLTLVWRTGRVEKSNEKPSRSNQSTKVEVVHSRGRSSEYKVQFHFIQAHSCCSAYTPYLPEVLQRGSLWEWLGRTQGKVEGDGHDVYSRETGKRENMAGDYSWLGTNIYGHTCNHIDIRFSYHRIWKHIRSEQGGTHSYKQCFQQGWTNASHFSQLKQSNDKHPQLLQLNTL